MSPDVNELHPVNIPTAFRTVMPNFLAWFTAKELNECFVSKHPWKRQVLLLVQQWAEERELDPLFPIFQDAVNLSE